ncbi:hypothetical protein [Vibrio breoganii]|uniref:hypothetical protein n=1 Tax=Vibrio breoganii TaxID=553239 RepID=UPI0021C3D2DE|nr:hypothetical protein [Vibrio breoganii]MDN3716537.1 hypothetical protein [Vibrio breoganii]
MNNFVWNNFGILKSVTKSGTMVLIKNNSRDTRKMSINKYKESALEVYEKAQTMIDKPVMLRTSQNTNNWDSNEWFSEIELVTPYHTQSDFPSVGETEPKPDQPF